MESFGSCRERFFAIDYTLVTARTHVVENKLKCGTAVWVDAPVRGRESEKSKSG